MDATNKNVLARRYVPVQAPGNNSGKLLDHKKIFCYLHGKVYKSFSPVFYVMRMVMNCACGDIPMSVTWYLRHLLVL